MILHELQTYLQAHQLDGWLLYDFRGTNPVALHVAGLTTSGSRRWFLWIPLTRHAARNTLVLAAL